MYSSEEFISILRSPDVDLGSVTRVDGAVKVDPESDSSLLFSPGGVCEEWVSIPLSAIQSVEDQGSFFCRGQSCRYARIDLRLPINAEARIFFQLLRLAINSGLKGILGQPLFDPNGLEPVFQASAINEQVCQAIVYGETGTLEVSSEAQLPILAEARRFIAGVAYKRDGKKVADPKYPTSEQLKQPFIKRTWDRCLVAAKEAAGDDVEEARHFVIWYSDDSGKTPSKKPKEIDDPWPYTQVDKITKSWGPFKDNSLGGDNIYVIQYTGVK